MDNTVVQILLSISISALVGLLMSRVCKLLKLPAVTGYLIAGIIVGCFCLGRIQLPGGLYLGFGKLDHGLSIICDVALGFIAFSIGSEFKLSELKKTGSRRLSSVSFRLWQLPRFVSSSFSCFTLFLKRLRVMTFFPFLRFSFFRLSQRQPLLRQP